MHSKPLFIIGTLFLALGLPGPASLRLKAANTGELRVGGSVRLALSQSPYFFDSILVEPGGDLIVDPGVSIFLPPTGRVLIEGRLVAVGSPALPILFSARENEYWTGFTAGTHSVVSLSEVQLKRFREPVRILGDGSSLGDIGLVDGIHNVLELGQEARVFSPLKIAGLRFTNSGADQAMEETGVIFRGDHPSIEVGGIVFQDGRPLSLQSLPIFVRIEGSYGQASFGNVIFPYHCPSALGGQNSLRHFELIPDRGICPNKPIPLVFIPGYGTSINLERLSSTDLEVTDLTGWRFFRQLDPSYFAFLAAAKAWGLPVEIAYYDWRLPAEVAARRYLEPVIERAKATYASPTVNIAAHSFGGLIARSYVQGDTYRGDVQKLLQFGTPNGGAAKAYGIWEGGVLPDDWQSLSHLLRYYEYQLAGATSRQETIQRLFPSVRDLLPVYPAVIYDGASVDLSQRNRYLAVLNATIDRLFKRVDSLVIASKSEPTPVYLRVGPPNPGMPSWPDGKPLGQSPLIIAGGDGTVPWESALAGDIPFQEAEGLHTDLPGNAAQAGLKWLYGGSLDIQHESLLKEDSSLSFVFDCPIEVEIRLPDGRSRSSWQADAAGVVGEVASSAALLWVVLPKEEGQYLVSITALADTEVRYWVENGPIQTLAMEKGESATRTILIGAKAELPSTESQLAQDGQRAGSSATLPGSSLVNSEKGRPVFSSAPSSVSPKSVGTASVTAPSSPNPGELVVYYADRSPRTAYYLVPGVIAFIMLILCLYLFKIVKRQEMCDDGLE